MSVLEICDERADQRFKQLLQGRPKLNARWIDAYANRVWSNRRLIEAYAGDLCRASVLEFGCNIGATAITLAKLGANVTAVDIHDWLLEIAEANARRFGIGEISFQQVPREGQLPFADNCFQVIVCNSVLEYVALADSLDKTLRELDRVLRPGGTFLVLGTSNRVWPREVHSGRWFVNYIPKVLAPSLQRGIWPWDITRKLPNYTDVVKRDRGNRYLEVKQRMRIGLPIWKLTPSFFLALQKPTPHTKPRIAQDA